MIFKIREISCFDKEIMGSGTSDDTETKSSKDDLENTEKPEEQKDNKEGEETNDTKESGKDIGENKDNLADIHDAMKDLPDCLRLSDYYLKNHNITLNDIKESGVIDKLKTLNIDTTIISKFGDGNLIGYCMDYISSNSENKTVDLSLLPQVLLYINDTYSNILDNVSIYDSIYTSDSIVTATLINSLVTISGNNTRDVLKPLKSKIEGNVLPLSKFLYTLKETNDEDFNVTINSEDAIGILVSCAAGIDTFNINPDNVSDFTNQFIMLNGGKQRISIENLRLFSSNYVKTNFLCITILETRSGLNGLRLGKIPNIYSNELDFIPSYDLLSGVPNVSSDFLEYRDYLSLYFIFSHRENVVKKAYGDKIGEHIEDLCDSLGVNKTGDIQIFKKLILEKSFSENPKKDDIVNLSKKLDYKFVALVYSKGIDNEKIYKQCVNNILKNMGGKEDIAILNKFASNDNSNNNINILKQDENIDENIEQIRLKEQKEDQLILLGFEKKDKRILDSLISNIKSSDLVDINKIGEKIFEKLIETAFSDSGLEEFVSLYRNNENKNIVDCLSYFLKAKGFGNILKHQNDITKLSVSCISSISSLVDSKTQQKAFNVISKDIPNIQLDQLPEDSETSKLTDIEFKTLDSLVELGISNSISHLTNGNKITKEFLIQNKDKILSYIESHIRQNYSNMSLDIITNNEIDDEKIFKYMSMLNEVFCLKLKGMSEEGIEIPENELDEIRQTIRESQDIKTDVEIIKEVGYQGYCEYVERRQAERDLLKGNGGISSGSIGFSDSMFDTKSDTIKTGFEKKDGVYTLQMLIPGKDEVIQVQSLNAQEGNQVLMYEYFKKQYNLPLEFKGNADLLNKLVTNSTDIAKDGINPEDLINIDNFFKNYIYNQFYVNGGKKEKDFLSENNLNMHDMYKDPSNFFIAFSNAMRNGVGGIRANFDKFEIDLSNLNSDYFNSQNFEKTAEEVFDNGRAYYEGSGILGNATKSINEGINTITKGFNNIFGAFKK